MITGKRGALTARFHHGLETELPFNLVDDYRVTMNGPAPGLASLCGTAVPRSLVKGSGTDREHGLRSER